MGRTRDERARDNDLVEQALLGELLPAGARDQGARRIHCKVAGVTHMNPGGSSRQVAIGRMAQFEFVRLERNPGDEHDPNAIKVLSPAGTQIGHLPADLSAELAPKIDAGEQWSAIVTRVGGSYTLGVGLMIFRT
jgi:hypothetical protein